METKTMLLIYVAVAFVFEAIFFYFMWRKFKNKMDEPQFQMVKGIVMSIKSAQALKKKIWNPFTLIFAGIPILALVSPFLFPLTLISMLKKLMFGKSKLEKEAEAEQKAMEEAQKKAAEFMKTEGREHINLAGKMGVGEDVNLDFNIDLNIEPDTFLGKEEDVDKSINPEAPPSPPSKEEMIRFIQLHIKEEKDQIERIIESDSDYYNNIPRFILDYALSYLELREQIDTEGVTESEFKHYPKKLADEEYKQRNNQLYEVTTINWSFANQTKEDSDFDENKPSPNYDEVHKNKYVMNIEQIISFLLGIFEIGEDVISIKPYNRDEML